MGKPEAQRRKASRPVQLTLSDRMAPTVPRSKR